MLKVIATAVLVIGGWLVFRGVYVWSHCGYDCAFKFTWINLTSTSAMLLGAMLLLAGIATLATMLPGVRPNGG